MNCRRCLLLLAAASLSVRPMLCRRGFASTEVFLLGLRSCTATVAELLDEGKERFMASSAS